MSGQFRPDDAARASPLQTALLQAEDMAAELRDYARFGDADGVASLTSDAMWPDATTRSHFVNAAEESSGNTALHMACANGHASIVQLLLERGADASVCNQRGNTALHWAAMNGQLACVQALLRAGDAAERAANSIDSVCDPWARNASGNTALDEAQQAQRHEVCAFLAEHMERHTGATTATADASDWLDAEESPADATN
ncbi:hypothetical protein CDCA_CDCA02G0600 [Cyanidium caldarium]|uniref:Uncharacterized protein n=1 Tax=Cyanidium caldarium TaxID=2771 RepID=A0AAV9IQJ0_CYACA|nr:hypothetical protein CDCA_CDCA02G0600 [Cyanidium caldarium]